MPLPPPDTTLTETYRDDLLVHARALFAGLRIPDQSGVAVFRSFAAPANPNTRTDRFIEWAVTGTQLGRFMGFRQPSPARTITIRIYSVGIESPPSGDNPHPRLSGLESEYDQLTILAQLGVRAVGRPVMGDLTLLDPDESAELSLDGTDTRRDEDDGGDGGNPPPA